MWPEQVQCIGEFSLVREFGLMWPDQVQRFGEFSLVREFRLVSFLGNLFANENVVLCLVRSIKISLSAEGLKVRGPRYSFGYINNHANEIGNYLPGLVRLKLSVLRCKLRQNLLVKYFFII